MAKNIALKNLALSKITIAATTAVVGGALVIGGAGTLAYWTDNASTSKEIQSGTLDLGTVTDAWTIQNGAGASAAFTGAVVPGDTLTTTVQVPVTLAGQNIKAELVVDEAAVTADASDAEAVALAGALDVTVVSVDGEAGSSAVLTESGTVPVVITVEFPFGTEGQYNDVTELADVTFAADYTISQKPIS